MITNWHMDHLSTQQQFIEYAYAYLKAGLDVCRRMTQVEPDRTWPNGTVANMLAVQSVELFLKGMIIHRNASFPIKTHDIDKLTAEFKRLYPEEAFQVGIPYELIRLGEGNAEKETPKNGRTAPSILFRYPVNDNLTPWNEVCGIEPSDFAQFLIQWQAHVERMVAVAAQAI